MQRSLSKAFSRSVGSDTPLGSATFKVMKLARINDQRGLREYFNVWVNADALRQQVNLLSKQKTAMLQLEGSLRSRARKAEEEPEGKGQSSGVGENARGANDKSSSVSANEESSSVGAKERARSAGGSARSADAKDTSN